MKSVVVIGAGIGGLSTAAVLARQGLAVTVLEAHVYPGGCAGTFYHQGYRFDSGATLAGGFYPGGPMDLLARAAGINGWSGQEAALPMLVHLPDGMVVPRWGDDRRWEAYRAAFGEASLDFWRWQERTADALWNLALRQPAWPPQRLGDLRSVLSSGWGWLAGSGLESLRNLPGLAIDALRPLAARLPGMAENLRLFVDAQLLISAQATSQKANALYGAAALDLPRRGVVHLSGGMGTIANLLAQAVCDHGGKVLYHRHAARLRLEKGRVVAVETNRGESFEADDFVANLPPWNIANLLGESAPSRLRRLPAEPAGWGAFVLYLGVDGSLIPEDFPLHHQVVLRRPLGEGNSTFLSISPAWDVNRAPTGKRALTLSTHTNLRTWWQLFNHDPAGYRDYKEQFTERLLAAAQKALPGIRQAVSLVLPGTPVTFQRFTQRKLGWVGGFPQTSLWRAWGPRLGPNLWMVGDSIFPGQSVAATALGGMRLAGIISQQRVIPDLELSIPREAVA